MESEAVSGAISCAELERPSSGFRAPFGIRLRAELAHMLIAKPVSTFAE
jgi:hypothetical protein